MITGNITASSSPVIPCEWVGRGITNIGAKTVLRVATIDVLLICRDYCEPFAKYVQKGSSEPIAGGQVYNADPADLLDKHDFQVREMWSAF